MFSDIPKLFDRDFIIGYFLPSAAFVGAFSCLINVARKIWGKGYISGSDFFPAELNPLSKSEIFALFGVTTWLLAVLLLVLNRHIYRLAEGYDLSGIRYLKKRQVSRFKSCLREKANFTNTDESCPQPIRSRGASQVLQDLAENFPQDESKILPTSFGNRLRAFEDYPRIMYGFELIPGWDYLRAVIAKEYLDAIAGAKAQTDFWLNLWFAAVIFVISCVLVNFFLVDLRISSVIVIALSFAWWFYHMARAALLDWGDLIKAACDTFLPTLRNKLELTNIKSSEEEREMWLTFSQAILYRSTVCMDSLDVYRDRTKASAKQD